MIETRESPTEYVVAVDGALDASSNGDFQIALSRALASTARTVSLDLKRASAIGPGAVGNIVTMLGDLKSQRRRFQVVACSDGVYRLLRQMRLHRLIKIRR